MPFAEGKSGNNEGRPNAWETWQSLYQSYGCQTHAELKAIDLTKIPIKKALAIKKILMAYEGDLRAHDSIEDRTDGKPKQTIEQEIRSNNTLSFEDVVANKINLKNE